MLSRRCSEDVVLFRQCYTGSPELLAQPCGVGLAAERLLTGCGDWVGFGGWGGLLTAPGGDGWVGCSCVGRWVNPAAPRDGDGGWGVTLVWGGRGKACASNWEGVGAMVWGQEGDRGGERQSR